MVSTLHYPINRRHLLSVSELGEVSRLPQLPRYDTPPNYDWIGELVDVSYIDEEGEVKSDVVKRTKVEDVFQILGQPRPNATYRYDLTDLGLIDL